MKPYVKTNIFVIIISVLSVLLIAVGIFSVVIQLENSALKNSSVNTSASAGKIEDNYNKIKAENEAILKEMEDIKRQNSELKKEIENQKKLLDSVNKEKLIVAEASLASQNSPHSTTAPSSKVCYLTFDDGPSEKTLQILKTLDEYNAKATFFVVGTGKLEYLTQIAEKGHTIGLHSNTHQIYSSGSNNIYSSIDAYFNDLNTLSDKVFEKCGIRSNVIRFPGGGSNTTSKKVCEGIMTRLTNQVQIKGYGYFDWNVDSGDAASNKVTAKQIASNVLTQAKNKNSICVLMHDLGNKQATVDALPEILKGLKSMGYSFEALTENSYGYHHKVLN